MFAEDFIFMFDLANKQGRVRFSAHQIPEKAQFFQVVGDHE